MTRKKMYASDFATRLSVNQTMVFYMDEVGLNLSMRRAYGYSPSGLKNLTVTALNGLLQGAPLTKIMVCYSSYVTSVKKIENSSEIQSRGNTFQICHVRCH